MKKLNIRAAAVMLSCVLTAAQTSFAVFAEEEAPARGTAVYYGTILSDETVQDDAALLAAGFDETDIECLKNGQDVTYTVRFDKDAPKTYYELAADSSEKQKIDAYYAGDLPEPEDSLMTFFTAARKRGDGETEDLEGVTGVKGKVALGLLPEQGDAAAFVQNGTFTMLYLGGNEAVKTETRAAADAEGYVVIDFNYLGSGNYIVLYDETEAAQTTTDTAAETTTTTAHASAAKQNSVQTPAAPKTGDAGKKTLSVIGALAGLTALLAGTRKRRKHISR